MANKVGAETTYFTHISHNLGLHNEVSKELPPHIKLAYDGLTFEVDWYICTPLTQVAKLVDAPAWGAGALKGVGVRISSWVQPDFECSKPGFLWCKN